MRPNPKESLTDYDFHMRWKKYISKDHPKLTKGINRGVLLGYVHQLADSGAHGDKCFTADATIGDDMELSRNTVAKYKTEAVRIGWLENTGTFGPHAAPIFRIAIPAHAPIAFDPDSKPVRKSNLGTHLNDRVSPKRSVRPAKPPAETPPVTDPWETNGVTKVVSKPIPGPGVLWGEAAMATEKANATPVDDSEAPKGHVGEWSTDCPRCDWYLLRNHPKHAQVCEEHMDSR